MRVCVTDQQGHVLTCIGAFVTITSGVKKTLCVFVYSFATLFFVNIGMVVGKKHTSRSLLNPYAQRWQ